MPRTKKPTGLKKVTHHYYRARKNPLFKIINLVIFAAVFAWLGHYFFPSHAADLTSCDTTGHSWPCHNDSVAANDRGLINSWRSGKGFYTLDHAACLDAAASSWAHHEASVGSISEPNVGSLVDKYCPNHYWLAVGANDGVGNSDSNIFNAFLISCLHFRNIADHGAKGNVYNMTMPNGSSCKFTSVHFVHVGTSVWIDKAGHRFVNETFARWQGDPTS